MALNCMNSREDKYIQLRSERISVLSQWISLQNKTSDCYKVQSPSVFEFYLTIRRLQGTLKDVRVHSNFDGKLNQRLYCG